MNVKMKIHLYEVNQPMGNAIQKIKDYAMEERVKNVSGYDMKMEEIKTEKHNGNNVFLMDFCKHRDSGPGRAKRDEKIQGFDLGEDEAFGEMTAALYDPTTNFIVVQYNHYGPRAGSIAIYLSEFATEQFIFSPRLKDDILAEIDKKQYNTSLELSYATASLTEFHKKELGIDTILNNTEAAMGSNIGEVKIIIKKPRGKHKKMENQNSLLKKIFRISSDDDSPITSAKVTGAMTPEDEPEILDILKAKIVDEREGLKIDQSTKMYSFDSRCKLLKQSFLSWKELDIIAGIT